jgi:hypothetical protein
MFGCAMTPILPLDLHRNQLRRQRHRLSECPGMTPEQR